MTDIYPSLFSLLRHLGLMGNNGLPLHSAPRFEVIELGEHNDGRLVATPMPMQPLLLPDQPFAYTPAEMKHIEAEMRRMYPDWGN